VFGELALRFVLGGAIVSAFAALGEVFTPKRFSGMFGAAPAVALVSLALAFHRHGTAYVAIEGKAMTIGAIAAHAAACVLVAKRRLLPVWAATAASLATWSVVAAVGFGLARASGVLP
jgi:hypothetical protein